MDIRAQMCAQWRNSFHKPWLHCHLLLLSPACPNPSYKCVSSMFLMLRTQTAIGMWLPALECDLPLTGPQSLGQPPFLTASFTPLTVRFRFCCFPVYLYELLSSVVPSSKFLIILKSSTFN